MRIGAPGSKADMAIFLFHEDPSDFGSDLSLYQVPAYEFKRIKEKFQGFPFVDPSESSLILVRSFVRHLQHEHRV